MIMNIIDFKNKKVVFTGKIDGKTREAVELLAQSIGLTVQKAVSKNTDFVIFGSDVGQTKLNKAMQLNIPTLRFKEFAKHATNFEDKILRKFNSIKKDDIESIVEFVLQYPFLINHISQSKLVVTILKKYNQVIRHLDHSYCDKATLKNLINKNGLVYQDIPREKQKDLDLIEAAMFAETNPKIHLCKRLLKIQMAELDLTNKTKAEKDYVWECYKKKLPKDDIFKIAQIKKGFFEKVSASN